MLVIKDQANLEFLDLLGQFASRSTHGLRFRECSLLEDSQDAFDRSEQVLNQNSLNVHLKLLDLQETSQDQLTELGTFDITLTDTHGIPGDQLRLKAAKSLLRPDGALGLLSRRVSSTADETAMLLYVKYARLTGPAIFVQNETIDVVIASVRNDEKSKMAVEEIHLLLLTTKPSSNVIALKDNLFKHLNSLGINVKTVTLSNALALKGSTVISLLEVESPLVISWDEEQFLQFQQQTTSASDLLWATCDGILNADVHSLQNASTTDLLRTLRVELPQIRLPHLDLCPSRGLASKSTAELLVTVLVLSTKINTDSKSIEMELVESNGSDFISRVVTDQSLDRELKL